MANNDPIKDYNPVNLKLERLQEKIEMYVGQDDPVTDLHDCSNDLSDGGSRMEEYEHAKYAEKVRKRLYGNNKQGFDVWSNKTTNNKNKKANNTSSIIFVVIIVIFYIFAGLVQIIQEIVDSFENNNYSNSLNSFYNDYSNYEDYDDYEINNPEFELYKKNIKVKLITTADNETYIEVRNYNEKSYEDLKIETIFYDITGQILDVSTTYTNILLGDNYHYYRIYNVPEKYDSCKINVLDRYGEYSEIQKNNFIIEVNEKTQNRENDIITLKSNCDEKINSMQILVVRSNTRGELSFETCYFYDIEWGVEQEKELYNFKGTEDSQIILTTINDLY